MARLLVSWLSRQASSRPRALPTQKIAERLAPLKDKSDEIRTLQVGRRVVRSHSRLRLATVPQSVRSCCSCVRLVRLQNEARKMKEQIDMMKKEINLAHSRINVELEGHTTVTPP